MWFLLVNDLDTNSLIEDNKFQPFMFFGVLVLSQKQMPYANWANKRLDDLNDGNVHPWTSQYRFSQSITKWKSVFYLYVYNLLSPASYRYEKSVHITDAPNIIANVLVRVFFSDQPISSWFSGCHTLFMWRHCALQPILRASETGSTSWLMWSLTLTSMSSQLKLKSMATALF